MKREKLKEYTKQIIDNLSDISKVTEILDEISTENDLSETEFESVSAKHDQLAEDNEKLREVNMKFFLKLGEKADVSTSKKQEEDDEGNAGDDLSFDNLFDEKGELI